MKVKAILLWFTAGIGGFALGYLFGRATAKRVYRLPERPEYRKALRSDFRFMLLRTAVLGITAGLTIFFAFYLTGSISRPIKLLKTSQSLPDSIEPDGQNQIPSPFRKDSPRFLYLTDPPQIINPESGKFKFAQPGYLPETPLPEPFRRVP